MEILDGKLVSGVVLKEIKEEIEKIGISGGRPPGITVVIVGEDPASEIYVRSKDKKAGKLGFRSEIIRLSDSISQKELMKVIAGLNQDPLVDAILVQLPLPDKFNEWEILDTIDPDKDVDRFHPLNLGKIMVNRSDIFPCTPAGIIRILDEYKIDVSGMDCVIVGRSFIVGKPVANMLTNRNATVTICHSRTKNIGEKLKKADLIIAALGRPGFVTGDMVKNGAILIDVGINRIDTYEDAEKLCDKNQLEKFKSKGYAVTGDISKEAFTASSFYTPVPGGVGPMTVAMLMQNTLNLYKKRVLEK
ncbi:MAG: bifunctional 5,10-methylenetetrahydrofolate dehydrogenase/5,10-methenyltetrahydrofolate cyclohydrolase [Acidobacteriota bacterium]